MDHASSSCIQRNIPDCLYGIIIRSADGTDGLTSLLQISQRDCKIRCLDILSYGVHIQSILAQCISVKLYFYVLFLSTGHSDLCHAAQCFQFRNYILIGKCQCIGSIGGTDRIGNAWHRIHIHLYDHRILTVVWQIRFYLIQCCPQIQICIIYILIIIILQKYHGDIFHGTGSDGFYTT